MWETDGLTVSNASDRPHGERAEEQTTQGSQDEPRI
jgi:hypothetical protein